MAGCEKTLWIRPETAIPYPVSEMQANEDPDILEGGSVITCDGSRRVNDSNGLRKRKHSLLTRLT